MLPLPALQLLLCALLPLLFTLLGDTAELYFSPTMAVVAQSIPKMRPRFAGGVAEVWEVWWECGRSVA